MENAILKWSYKKSEETSLKHLLNDAIEMTSRNRITLSPSGKKIKMSNSKKIYPYERAVVVYNVLRMLYGKNNYFVKAINKIR